MYSSSYSRVDVKVEGEKHESGEPWPSYGKQARSQENTILQPKGANDIVLWTGMVWRVVWRG